MLRSFLSPGPSPALAGIGANSLLGPFSQLPFSVRAGIVGFRGSETQSGCLSPDIGAGDSSPALLLFSFGTLQWLYLLMSTEEEIKVYRALCKP